MREQSEFMTYLRKSEDRGHVQAGWLDSRHTFSFGDYFDPKHMSFKSLRVINEDYIAGGNGFGAHPHKDMEIITYMVSGALKHKDSTGQEGVIVPGEVQMMTAGRGIVHSEVNASPADKAHLLQIWIHPKERGLEPSYQQKNFSEELKPDSKEWTLLVSPHDSKTDLNSLKIHQDLRLWARKFGEGESLQKELDRSSSVWVQVVSGTLEWEGQTLSAGDGLGIDTLGILKLHAKSKGEVLLFVFQ
ncbi:MAG: pirin family protein [Bdellovibrionota bacterium]